MLHTPGNLSLFSPNELVEQIRKTRKKNYGKSPAPLKFTSPYPKNSIEDDDDEEPERYVGKNSCCGTSIK